MLSYLEFSVDWRIKKIMEPLLMINYNLKKIDKTSEKGRKARFLLDKLDDILQKEAEQLLILKSNEKIKEQLDIMISCFLTSFAKCMVIAKHSCPAETREKHYGSLWIENVKKLMEQYFILQEKDMTKK
jgi:hypothetical protein